MKVQFVDFENAFYQRWEEFTRKKLANLQRGQKAWQLGRKA